MKAVSPTYQKVLRAACCAVTLGAWACSSSDEAHSTPLDAGGDAENAATGGTVGTGGANSTGGRSPSSGGTRPDSGGTNGNTGGRMASGGASSGGSAADAG